MSNFKLLPWRLINSRLVQLTYPRENHPMIDKFKIGVFVNVINRGETDDSQISVSNVFIVADIVDEVIIGADFNKVYGIRLDMGQQFMGWRNDEIR